MNRWSIFSYKQEDAPPIELRFIDLFLAMVGCLIFLAMLLSLLPKAGFIPESQLDKAKKEIKELQEKSDNLVSEVKALKSRLGCGEQSCQALGYKIAQKWFPPSVTRFWLHVRLETKNCYKSKPQLYVRYDGPLYDIETDKQVDNALKFDPADVVAFRTMLDGDRYDVVDDKNGSVELNFWGIRASGLSYIYVGLGNLHGNETCTLTPMIATRIGDYIANSVALTATHPYGLISVIDSENDKGVMPWIEPSKADLAIQIKKINETGKEALAKIGVLGVSAAEYPHWRQIRTAS